MEASAAAGPAAPAADGGGEAQEGQQQQQQSVPQDLLEQLGNVPGQLEQMRQWMEDSQQQQVEPAETATEPPAQPDLSFVDPASENYDPQRAAQELLGLLEQQNSQALQQAVAPLQEQIQDMRTSQEAADLASQFPELEDEATANEVFKAAKEWTTAIGHPELATNMQVVKAVYMMGRAAELSNQEQSGGEQQAATLEGAGGASPGGQSGGLTAASIVGDGARRVLPFG